MTPRTRTLALLPPGAGAAGPACRAPRGASLARRWCPGASAGPGRPAPLVGTPALAGQCNNRCAAGGLLDLDGLVQWCEARAGGPAERARPAPLPSLWEREPGC